MGLVKANPLHLTKGLYHSNAYRSMGIPQEVEKMRKEEIRQMVEATGNKVYVVGLAKDRHGMWAKFAVYVKNPKSGELVKLWWTEEEDYPSLWVPRHRTRSGNWTGGYFESRVIGSDRVFEVVYRLSSWLYDYQPRAGYRLKYEFLSA